MGFCDCRCQSFLRKFVFHEESICAPAHDVEVVIRYVGVAYYPTARVKEVRFTHEASREHIPW